MTTSTSNAPTKGGRSRNRPQGLPAPRNSRMAEVYRGDDLEVPWEGFQNAGPDCFWPVDREHPVN